MLFCVAFNNFLQFFVVIENAKLKLAAPIPKSAPITVANEAIEMLPLAANKTVKAYQKSRKKQYIY